MAEPIAGSKLPMVGHRELRAALAAWCHRGVRRHRLSLVPADESRQPRFSALGEGVEDWGTAALARR